MSFDHWKTTNPDDEWLGPEPESEEEEPEDHFYESVQERAAAHAADALHEHEQRQQRLPCGCYGKCNPYAHDTAWDWDGTPDGPYYTSCPECDGKIYEDDETPHKCDI